MNLYKISQSVNNDYDTYDSAVVAAESEHEARRIHSGTDNTFGSSLKVPEGQNVTDADYGSWTSADNVEVVLIGIAEPNVKRGVIVASYNAG